MRISASYTTEKFRRAFQQLPLEVQRSARKAYLLWRQDPEHNSLHFKRVHATRPYYSVRVGIDWRALGLLEGDTMVWFWIGSHAEYDRMVGKL